MKNIHNRLAAQLGVSFFDYQVEAFDGWDEHRACLFYKTGAGKSITSLVMLKAAGHDEAVVVTPPATYPQWVATAAKIGMNVTCMSHAKFRMKDTKVSRTVPIVMDEFHLLGGHTGKGWKKLDTMAVHLKAPLILASATPNYNDAERVYCIQHVLDPNSCRGGFIEFLYRHCVTEQDPFSMTPKVLGFHAFKDAAEYLASLPGVFYLPDDLTYSITDIPLLAFTQGAFDTYGYDTRTHRIMASRIETDHKRVFNTFVARNGEFYKDVYDQLAVIVGNSATPVLIFANHSTIAEALDAKLGKWNVKAALVTGDTPAKKKAERIQAFKDGVLDVLVGTATLATGTDGMDKMCDTLIILDDTNDDALRRQLIGRIMPRGADQDASKKQVYRFLLS